MYKPGISLFNADVLLILGRTHYTLLIFQERAIPLLLEGKDLLARGRTGSGKTGAFSIPLVQRILDVKVCKQIRYLTGTRTRSFFVLPLSENRCLSIIRLD